MMAVAGEVKGVEALERLTPGASADSDGSVHCQMYLLCRKLDKPDDAAIALLRSQGLRRVRQEKALNEPLAC